MDFKFGNQNFVNHLNQTFSLFFRSLNGKAFFFIVKTQGHLFLNKYSFLPKVFRKALFQFNSKKNVPFWAFADSFLSWIL